MINTHRFVDDGAVCLDRSLPLHLMQMCESECMCHDNAICFLKLRLPVPVYIYYLSHFLSVDVLCMFDNQLSQSIADAHPFTQSQWAISNARSLAMFVLCIEVCDLFSYNLETYHHMCMENNSTDLEICMCVRCLYVWSEDSATREVCKLPIEKYHSSRYGKDIHKVWILSREKKGLYCRKIQIVLMTPNVCVQYRINAIAHFTTAFYCQPITPNAILTQCLAFRMDRCSWRHCVHVLTIYIAINSKHYLTHSIYPILKSMNMHQEQLMIFFLFVCARIIFHPKMRNKNLGES